MSDTLKASRAVVGISLSMNASEIFHGKAFGLGGVPFGNEFAYLTDEVAYATVDAAWEAGVRYYDIVMVRSRTCRAASRQYFASEEARRIPTIFEGREVAHRFSREQRERVFPFSRLRQTIFGTITPRTASNVPSKTAFSV